MEVEEGEEGSPGGRQVVGTKSWEAEVWRGGPGAGVVGMGMGMGEVSHVTFSCSSSTSLGEGRDQEGIQEVNGTGTPEMVLPMGKGSTEQRRLTWPQKGK